MSKNTGNTQFRKLNVSPYSDDEDVEETPVDAGGQGPNESEVQSMLQQRRNLDALKYVLSSSPVETKNQGIKDKAAQLVLQVLLSFSKKDEIDAAVDSLDQQGIDMLMKYIYRGFEFPSEGSSGQLLTWHEKTFQKGGLGSIVRTLTDRKRV